MGDRHGGRFARRGRALNPPARRSTRTAGWGSDATGRWAGFTPAQERSPRRKPPDTAHERRDLPRARRLSSAKASRHGARAKKFAPRRNTPLGEGLPTQRKGERICPTREGSPRRRPPDTARRRKDLPTRECPPRRKHPDTAHERKDLSHAGFAFAPRADERRAALGRRTARKTPLRRGRTHSVRPLPSSFT